MHDIRFAPIELVTINTAAVSASAADRGVIRSVPPCLSQDMAEQISAQSRRFVRSFDDALRAACYFEQWVVWHPKAISRISVAY